MLRSEIREILAEQEEVQRRKAALESLLSMRAKLLHESLAERIRRAQDHGEWIHLSQEQCAALHEQEKRYFTSQVERLRHEQARTRRRLAVIRGAKARANHIRAAAVASRRKRH